VPGNRDTTSDPTETAGIHEENKDRALRNKTNSKKEAKGAEAQLLEGEFRAFGEISAREF